MNELQNFDFQGNSVRVIMNGGEPYFVGIDVTGILGYRNGSRDINRHVEPEDRIKSMVSDGNQKKETILINESGLYSLMFGSDLPSAKKFKYWVTNIVLPTIQKHGAYLTPDTAKKVVTDPEFLRDLASKFEEERRARQLAESQVQVMKPKALYADMLDVSETSILVSELAKLLKQKGVEIGQQRLFSYLRKNGYLISGNRSDHNLPTQKSMKLGLFKIKTTPVFHNHGDVETKRTTVVTVKGQRCFIEKFLKQEV